MAEKTVLCYNCFQEKETQEGPCPYCGFDLAENEKKFPVALRAGTVLNGRYIVGRVLGQGGFGITYLAWDTKLEARVAVKEFMPNEIATRVGTTVSVAVESRTQDFTYGAERFQEEARTLAKFMGQPNIAGVTDYFDENDTSYFVMDYIEGISFKTYIANHGGKISVEETLNVMIPVLRALTAVHAEGFIHRDVTPDNIYITKGPSPTCTPAPPASTPLSRASCRRRRWSVWNTMTWCRSHSAALKFQSIWTKPF